MRVPEAFLGRVWIIFGIAMNVVVPVAADPLNRVTLQRNAPESGQWKPTRSKKPGLLGVAKQSKTSKE